MSTEPTRRPADPASPDRTEVPFGWWPSPLTASRVAAGKVSRSGLQSDATAVAWTESRPEQGGRQVVVCCQRGSGPREISPEAVSVRSRVHEYGGGQATLTGDALFYVAMADQRWYRTALTRSGVPGSTGVPVPVALTPDHGDSAVDTRYADGRLTRSGQWLVSVEERVGPSGTGHRLVAIDPGGSGRVVPLFDGSDFVAAPRPSPDGSWLAWVVWDHPDMPWDRSALMVGHLVETAEGIALDPVGRVAGGRVGSSSVGQPRWCRDGSLVFMDDRTGWWLPYRLPADRIGVEGAEPDRLVGRRAEFHDPDWTLGQSTVAEMSDGSLVCRMREGGRDHLVRLVPPANPAEPGWSAMPIAQPCVSITGVVASPPRPEHGADRVVILGSTPSEAHLVVEVVADGTGEAVPPSAAEAGRWPPGANRLSSSAGPVGGAPVASVAVPFTAAGGAGPVPGQFFPPTSSTTTGPPGELPPLVVFCHGGPTASADPGFDPVIQYFASRGLAVAVVDYRGSSGYGREYRQALAGQWGVADIDDCVAYATALGEAGLVDPARLAIRGTSAGGLTALGALIRSDRFAGAASWYGVTDLSALAADTHDFESRYMDSLVGPWPSAAERYGRRSPLHHADQISGSVLLLQGADDPVVPPDQAERFATMLEAAGVPCSLTVFAGESHGFRRSETIEACLEAELEFYRGLFTDPVLLD